MLFEINNTNIDNFIKIINENVKQNENKSYIMVMYHTRTVHPYIKLLICTKKEWLLMQQFVISSEYMKGNIDVICNVEISEDTLSLIRQELTARKEYIYEKNTITTHNFNISNLNWL